MGFGFVVKNPQTKTYTLGPGLVFLARQVLENLDHRAVVSPFLMKLAKETSSTALFGLISGSQVFIVGKQEGDQNVGVTIGLGHRFHITSGAHGKAIAAFLPEHERDKILERKALYFYGKDTPMDRNRLERDLEACRKRGFAQDTGDLQPGILAVSAPVFDHLNRVAGCLILIGTFPRNKIGPYGDRVDRTARQISTRLGAEVETIYRKAREGFP
jgi:DNA-binding IclR family transcriptional regulator